MTFKDKDKTTVKQVELRNTLHFQTQLTTRGLVHKNKKKYDRKAIKDYESGESL